MTVNSNKRYLRSLSARYWASVALVAACAVFIQTSCRSHDHDPQVGSETNFLKHCSSECDQGLSCICGVCTRACTGPTECATTAVDAQCVSVPGNPAASAGSCERGAICDLGCNSTDDCAGLGASYRCEMGYCRKGALVCPAGVLTAGDQDRTLVVDGTTRAYTMHLPANYSGGTPVPLVLDFHPMALGASWEQANSGYAQLSDQEGFIVVWPLGLENTWNVGPCCALSTPADDFGFARALVRQLSSEACIDPQRVYAVGFSLGASMAYYLACQQAEVFAAVAASSMDLFVDSEITCNPSRAVSEISFRGTADTVTPYAGGSSSPPGHADMVHTLLGATGTFEKWAALNQCTGTPTAEDANGCSTYATCQDSTEVTLCTTQGGGQVTGDASIAWKLLKRHAMP
jgi:polyhydroxybutyrate depolymerase